RCDAAQSFWAHTASSAALKAGEVARAGSEAASFSSVSIPAGPSARKVFTAAASPATAFRAVVVRSAVTGAEASSIRRMIGQPGRIHRAAFMTISFPVGGENLSIHTLAGRAPALCNACVTLTGPSTPCWYTQAHDHGAGDRGRPGDPPGIA